MTTDFLTKRSKKNEGEAPKYFVENSHEGIISRETYDMVQNEMKRRSDKMASHSCKDILSGHLICGDCGSAYGSKLWHSTSKYRRVVWQCNRKFVSEEHCQTPHVDENVIKEMFVQAVNKLILNRDEIIQACGDIMLVLENNHDLDSQQQSFKVELKKVRDDIEKLVVLNAAKVLDQKEYARQYDGLIMAYREIQQKEAEMNEERERMRIKMMMIRSFLQTLQTRENLLSGFEDGLWHAFLKQVEIHRENQVTFVFQDGTKITLPLPVLL